MQKKSEWVVKLKKNVKIRDVPNNSNSKNSKKAKLNKKNNNNVQKKSEWVVKLKKNVKIRDVPNRRKQIKIVLDYLNVLKMASVTQFKTQKNGITNKIDNVKNAINTAREAEKKRE